MSDRLVARLPGLMRRLMTSFLAEPAGPRARRWIIDRGLLAGFAATDASDWDWLSRVYEADVVVRIADDALPDLPSRTDGFAALRMMIEESRDRIAGVRQPPG